VLIVGLSITFGLGMGATVAIEKLIGQVVGIYIGMMAIWLGGLILTLSPGGST